MATKVPSNAGVQRYIQAAKQAGCRRDQIGNFVAAGCVLQPKQLQASAAARLCDAPDGPTKIGYGGSRGGGKSHWLLVQLAADDCQRYPGLKCLLLRKVGKALKEGFEDLIKKLLVGLDYHYTPSEKKLEFPNGSFIILGHFQNEKDIDAYLGLEYDVIGIEEATTLTKNKADDIETCNRSSKPNWRPRMYYTTNPGNVGHAWFKQLFIEPLRRGTETLTRFIQATVYDNSFVNPEYRGVLERLTGWKRRAWLDGDWDIAAGAFFTTFRRDVHVVKPRPIPRDWRVWCSLDYGFTHYTTVYLLAQSNDGDVYHVAEHAERGWLPQRHAQAIKAMLARHSIPLHRLETFVAGSDVFNKRGNESGTIADQYAAQGIELVQADNDRINGAGEYLARLGDVDADPPIMPRMFFSELCPRLIETVPLLQHDPHRPEDVLKWDTDEDGNGGDDFYDGSRYGLMVAARPTKVFKPASGGQRQHLQQYRPR